MQNEYHELLKKIAKELNIKIDFLSKDWVIKLTKDEKIRFISGYRFGLNDHALGSVFDDKYATYDALNSLDIPIIKHKIFFRSSNKFEYAKNSNSFEDIKSFFNEYNQDIVVKANTGSQGTDVYHITNLETLEKVTNNLFINNFSISLCPFYHIKNEYRFIMLDGKIMLRYKKIKPLVIGDGKSTIKQLLTNFNKPFFENRTIEEDHILMSKEEYEYDWRFNLSQGSIISMDIDNDLEKRLNELANDVYKKTNFMFASVDIIHTNDNRLYILEVNSGVTILKFTHLHPKGNIIAHDIYKKAIEKMFKL